MFELDLERFNRWLDNEALERAGISSRADLARRMNVCDATMYRWLNGERRPGWQELALMARTLGVSRYELYRELGLLPPMVDEDREQLVQLLLEANPTEVEYVEKYARFLVRERLDAEQRQREEQEQRAGHHR